MISITSSVDSIKPNTFDKVYMPMMELMNDELNQLEDLHTNLPHSQIVNDPNDDKRKRKYELNKLFSEKKQKQDYNLNNLTLVEENVVAVTVENIENWDILYLCLINVEKLSKLSSYWKSKLSNKDFQILIFSCLKHPHSFVKTVSLRLIGYIFEELKEKGFNQLVTNITDEDYSLLNNLIVNLKHIFTDKDSSDKLMKTSIDISVYLLEKLVKLSNENQTNFLSNLAFEFVCRLYIDSKKFFSKKENANVIFGRIFNLFEIMCVNYDSIVLNNFLDPILSLIYRIKTNKLIEDKIKENSNLVFEKLSKKYVNDEYFNEVYKNVSKNINLLRKKRKTEILQDAIKNPQNFVKKQYNNKKKN